MSYVAFSACFMSPSARRAVIGSATAMPAGQCGQAYCAYPTEEWAHLS